MSQTRVRPGIARVESEAETVSLMFHLCEEGLGMPAIARELMARGILSPSGARRWHTAVVRRILRNPLHAGLLEDNGRLISGAHRDQRLIEPEQFHEVQRLLDLRGRKSGRTGASLRAPLARIASCAECKHKLTAVHPELKSRGYRCQQHQLPGGNCKSRPYVRGEFLEPRVSKALLELASSPEVLAEAKREALRLLEAEHITRTKRPADVKRALADLERRTEELAGAYAASKVSQETFLAADAKLKESRTALEQEQSHLTSLSKARQNVQARFARVEGLLDDLPGLWDSLSPTRQRGLYETLIEKLEIGLISGTIRVWLKFWCAPDQVFDLPIAYQWQRTRPDAPKPPASLRELASLALRGEGLTRLQIAKRFQTGVKNVATLEKRAIRHLGASCWQEAAALASPLVEEWYDLLPLEGRMTGHVGKRKLLSDRLLASLRCAAAGFGATEEAAELGVPCSTVQGRHNALLQKLDRHHMEGAIAKALDLGLLVPEEPSIELLLRACRQLAAGDLAEQLGVERPTALQVECLELLRQGLNQPEAAKRRKVSQVAINATLRRLWKALGAASFREALQRVQELGLPAANPEEPSEEETQDDWSQSKQGE